MYGEVIYRLRVQSSRLELRLKIDLTPLCGVHPQDPVTLKLPRD
jgi:hypothetical protein